MEIREVLINIAEKFGMSEDDIQKLKEDSSISSFSGSSPVAVDILALFNMACRDLCKNYISFEKRVVIKTIKSKYSRHYLGDTIFMIKRAEKNGEPVNFRTINHIMEFEEDGEYTLYYDSYPRYLELDEIVDERIVKYLPYLELVVLAYWSLSLQHVNQFDDFIERAEEEMELIKGENT